MEGDMLFSLTLFLPILLLSYLIIFKPKNNKQRKSLPPSPRSLPIIGHLHLLKGPYHRALESLSRRYGPVLYLRFGQQPFVVVSSPQAAEQCFTQNDIILANRPKFIIGQHLDYNFSTIVWASYGDRWRSLRKAMNVEALSAQKMNQSSSIRQEEILFMVRHLIRAANTKVNMAHMFHKLIHDIIVKILTGDKWDESRMDLFPSVGIMNICDFVPLLRWVGYKGLEKDMMKLQRSVDEFLQDVLEDIRKRDKLVKEEGVEKKKTLLEQFLHLQHTEPDQYTDETLKGIMSVMLTAGVDTTAKTMEWAMSLLLSHPKILEKARDEINSHVGNDHIVNESDLPKLTYLKCIINETLRLYPVAPLLIPHFSSQDCTIEGYHIPKGTVLLVNAWALHRSPKFWEDPTEFRPERFIGVEGDREGFKFLPFGVGRRACPGANLAMRMVSLVLATLIQCFDWEMMELELDMAERDAGVTIPKDKPLEVLCSPRSILNEVSHM